MASQYKSGSKTVAEINAERLKREMQSTDPDVLARVAREHASRSLQTAGLCAGFAGRCAAMNNKERTDCPFTDLDDADLADKWLFWFDATVAGLLADGMKNTADLIEDFSHEK